MSNMSGLAIKAGFAELIKLSDGHGGHNSLDTAISSLDALPTMPVVEQREVVSSYSNELMRGVLSYNTSPKEVAELSNKLRDLSYRLGMEAYTHLFDLLWRYDELPEDSTAALEARGRFDETGSKVMITAGARIVEVVNGEADTAGVNKDNLIRTAGNVFLYVLKHGGPEMQIKAIEALSHFRGSELKRELDRVARKGDLITKKTVEEAIDGMRAREQLDEALGHKRVFLARYRDESLPKRFIIDIAYESIETLLSGENNRSISGSIENTVAVRQLITLLKSYPDWSRNVFPSEGRHDYENDVERNVLVADIENTLLHVVKRGKKEDLRKEVAEVLAKNGNSEKVKEIFKKIFGRRDSGYDLVRKYTIPEPRAKAKSVPPPPPGSKKANLAR